MIMGTCGQINFERALPPEALGRASGPEDPHFFSIISGTYGDKVKMPDSLSKQLRIPGKNRGKPSCRKIRPLPPGFSISFCLRMGM
jgi:hypothetical protein